MQKPIPQVLAPDTLLLNQYLIERVLGQGGFGVTYLARDVRLDMAVALKEYFASEIAVRDGNQIRPKSEVHRQQYTWGLTRFLEEARNLARFRHPNIVQVHNFFEDRGTAYMVMAYEEGDSLADILRKRKTLPEQELCSITLPLLAGLDRLHSAGFIHRDIKPGNIYIRKDGSPVLLDFGAARQAIGEKTKSLTTMLTPGYAPFEQYYSSSKKQGPWTDIYSMAAVLYRSVTGKVPIHATDRSSAMLRNEADPLKLASELCKGNYSPGFLYAVDSALCVLEEERPHNVDTWILMLEQKDVPAAIVATPASEATTAAANISSNVEKHRSQGQTAQAATTNPVSQNGNGGNDDGGNDDGDTGTIMPSVVPKAASDQTKSVVQNTPKPTQAKSLPLAEDDRTPQPVQQGLQSQDDVTEVSTLEPQPPVANRRPPPYGMFAVAAMVLVVIGGVLVWQLSSDSTQPTGLAVTDVDSPGQVTAQSEHLQTTEQYPTEAHPRPAGTTMPEGTSSQPTTAMPIPTPQVSMSQPPRPIPQPPETITVAADLPQAAKALAQTLAYAFKITADGQKPQNKRPLVDLSQSAFVDSRNGAIYPFSKFLVTELRQALAATDTFVLTRTYDPDKDLAISGEYYQEAGKLIIIARLQGTRQRQDSDEQSVDIDLAQARITLEESAIVGSWFQQDVRHQLAYLLRRIEQKAALKLAKQHNEVLVYPFKQDNTEWVAPLGKYLQEATFDYLSNSHQLAPVSIEKSFSKELTTRNIVPTTSVQETLTTLASVPYYITGHYWQRGNNKLEMRVRLANQRGRILASDSITLSSYIVEAAMLQLPEQEDPQFDADYQAIKPNKPGRFRAEVFTQKGRDGLRFAIGEQIRFHIKLNQPGFMHILNRGADGTFYQIFPNNFHPDAKIPANQIVIIPDRSYGFQFDVQAPLGNELVKIYAADQPLPQLPGTDVGNGFRSIAVDAKTIQKHYRDFAQNSGASLVEDILSLRTVKE